MADQKEEVHPYDRLRAEVEHRCGRLEYDAQTIKESLTKRIDEAESSEVLSALTSFSERLSRIEEALAIQVKE